LNDFEEPLILKKTWN